MGSESHTARVAHDASLAADLADRRARWDVLPDTPRQESLEWTSPGGAPVAGEWHAIDEVPIIDCVISYSSHLQDVPSALLIPWRTVVADVLRYILQARRTGDVDALERGLKWHLAIHDIMLRGPARGTSGGGRDRSSAYVSRRFDLWAHEGRQQLVDLWVSDRARDLSRRRSQRTRTGGDSLERVFSLIRDGELAQATGQLFSFGIADVTPAVLAQLRAKYPARAQHMPQDLPDAYPLAPPVHLTDTFRSLRRRRGTGVSGARNEFLRALVGASDDQRADQVMPLMDEYGTVFARAQFPRWYYAARSALVCFAVRLLS